MKEGVWSWLQPNLEDSEPPAGLRNRAEEPAAPSLEWPDSAKRGWGDWNEVGGGFGKQLWAAQVVGVEEAFEGDGIGGLGRGMAG